MAKTPNDLILASASPVRARLLRDAGVAFRIEPAEIDEGRVKRAARAAGEAATACALTLASGKARDVSARHRNSLVIGADQILVLGNEWLDKPADLAAARTQLQMLRGRTHELATAAAVLRAGEPLWQTVSVPRLTMRIFSEDFLDWYIAAEDAALLGSVGAYRLEGRGVQLFSEIEGDHFAVLGLPIIELLEFLRECGALKG
jgi:septum formation protein